MKFVLIFSLLAFLAFPDLVLHAQALPTPDTVTATRSLWPKEVTVNVAHEVPIVINGRTSGMIQSPAGRKYPLKSLTATEVVVDAMGNPMAFAVGDTDLLARAGAIQTRLAAVAAVPVPVTPNVASPAATAAPTPTPKAAVPEIQNVLAGKLQGDLVTFKGRKFEKFTAASLAGKKYLAIYFSAAWCGPCRAFTPDLVKWYKRKKSKLDQFDIIFDSSDRTEEAMLDYMKEDKMAWPAVAYDKRSKSPLKKYKGRGIPCLVVIDAAGNVVAHSYEGKTYIGPRKVLKDLDKLLKRS